MLSKIVFTSISLVFSFNLLFSQVTLIDKGEVWSYYDLGNDPEDQNGVRWYDLNYDDSTWNSGQTHMGYGDNDEVTTVKNGIRTLYVRKSINISNPSLYESAAIDLVFDDGAIVYVNGKEISRLNMPSGVVTSSTFASSVGEENGEVRITLNNELIQGKNTIAVEIHQESSTSSDISFDLSLGPFQRNLDFESSSLPLIFIKTDNNSFIPDEPKVGATMQIVFNEDGSENRVDATEFHFVGRIGIELRGQSSLALFPKKGYGIETWDEMDDDKNVGLLGFPEESDWVIHSPYSDKSLLRNVLSYHLGAQIMTYAPRVKLCELIINEQYLGVVVFTEKIKRDKNRVDINRLSADEISGDKLTGGYILKFDKSTPDEVAWVSQYRPIPGRSNSTEFIYHYPKPEDISNEQKTYIRNWITEFERTLKSNDFDNPSSGYRKYADVNSFIDMFIMNEITRNVDGYRLSTFMHKQKDSDGGKLIMGPIWDYNLAFGNANYCDGGETWGWAHQFNRVCPDDKWVNAFWWDRLLSDNAFRQQFKDRYFYFRENVLSTENVMATIDSLVTHMGPAVERNFGRWRILGQYIWPNNFVGSDYNSEINELKRWIIARFEWLDQNIKSLTTDVVEITQDSPIQLGPNPSAGRLNFNVQNSTEFKQIRIFTMNGRLVQDIPFNRSIDISPLALNGLHIVHVVHDDGTLYMDKIMIQN